MGVQQLLSHQPLKQKWRVERLVGVLCSLPECPVKQVPRWARVFEQGETPQELLLSCDVPMQTRDDSLTDW